jgi:hypothetical protein
MPVVTHRIDRVMVAELRDSRLLVHDSEHDLLVLTLEIEEQVRK